MTGPTNVIFQGMAEDRLGDIPAGTIQCCVTSPPYWGQRVYEGCPSSLGLEPTQAEYVSNLVGIFDQVKTTLHKSGVLWLNIGDGFYTKTISNRNGATKHLGGKTRGGGEYKLPVRSDKTLKQKDLCGTPWTVAMALRDSGWYLRDAIVWHKPAPMPGGSSDRCVPAYEMVFMLTKSKSYYFDEHAIAEDGVTTDKRRCRNVWTIPSAQGNGWHFARMPYALAERCIIATTHEGDSVLDPFHGSGTTGEAANDWGRQYVGVEPCLEYIEKSKKECE